MQEKQRHFAEYLSALLLSIALLAGCDDGTVDTGTPTEYSFTFEDSDEGWEGDFVDYGVDRTDEELELVFDRRTLPAELNRDDMGLYFAGRNLSDDLFMYAKRELTGLEADRRYRVEVRVSIASNAPSGCAGIGGPPGEAVRVKVGAAGVEPVPVAEDGIYRLNVDKDVSDGDAAGAGAVREVGTVANGIEQCTGPIPYRMITRSNVGDPLEAATDENGTLWLFVGTDSGFEGKTTLYYDRIDVTVDE